MVSFAFGKNRRIRRRADFQRTQTRGERVTTRHFVWLVTAPNAIGPLETRPPARLGIVASRKLGGAVERNRIKRLCRECFRTWPEFLPGGVDLVVIARSGAERLGLADIRDEWTRARASVLRKIRQLEAENDTAQLASRANRHHVPDHS